jgi:hypothetical protein
MSQHAYLLKSFEIGISTHGIPATDSIEDMTLGVQQYIVNKNGDTVRLCLVCCVY